MSGGQTATRGFLLQTLVTILGAFSKDGNDKKWVAFEVEPDTEHDKTDIRWHYSDGTSRAVQVKSSKNQIGLASATEWAQSLSQEKAATSFELILIGPCSGDVTKAGKIGEIEIPTPKSLDILGLFQQATHGLDRYLETRNISSLPVAIRELLVEGLTAKLLTYSTKGEKVSRDDLDNLLISWILSVLPEAVKTVLYSRCEVLCDSIILAATKGIQHQIKEGIPILLPLHFLNGGERPSIIETLALMVRTPQAALIYEPIGMVNFPEVMKNKRIDNKFVHSMSTWIIVPKGEVKEAAVCFFPVDIPPDHPFAAWEPGDCSVEIYVQYRGEELATQVAILNTDFSAKDLSAPKEGGTIIHMVGKIAKIS